VSGILLPPSVSTWLRALTAAETLGNTLTAGLPCRFDVTLLPRAEQAGWTENGCCYPLIYSRSEAPEQTRAVVGAFIGDIPLLHAAPRLTGAADLSGGLMPWLSRFTLAGIDESYAPLHCLRTGEREPPRWALALTLDACGQLELQPEARARYQARQGFNVNAAAAARNGNCVATIQPKLEQLRHLLRQRLLPLSPSPAVHELLQAITAGLAMALLNNVSDRHRINRWVPSRYLLVHAADFQIKSTS
jgi:hypothetical protein